MLRHVLFFEIPWTGAHQTPLSMEFSIQEHWSGLPFLSPGDLLYPGIEPMSLSFLFEPMSFVSPALESRYFTIYLQNYWLPSDLEVNIYIYISQIKILS